MLMIIIKLIVLPKKYIIIPIRVSIYFFDRSINIIIIVNIIRNNNYKNGDLNHNYFTIMRL